MTEFEPGQLVACWQYYACGTLIKGWLPGVIIEKQKYFNFESYLVLESGETKPARYDVEALEDYGKFLERQNKLKKKNS